MTCRPPAPLTYRLPLDALTCDTATFDVHRPGSDAGQLTMPRAHWEGIGRPAWLDVELRSTPAEPA